MHRLGVIAVLLVACGGDDNTNTKQDAHNVDSAAPKDSAADAPLDARPDAPPDAPPDAAAGTQQLTVKNVEVWCSVSVNGGAASSGPTQTVSVQPGQITLTATPLATFELAPNMWHHTDGDTSGTGEAGTVTGNTSATTVTVTSAGAKCVWVCCPFENSGGGCPTTEQCP